MTSRRETLRALGSIAALPFLGSVGVEQLLEVGQRAHARAEALREGVPEFAPRVLTPAQYDMVAAAAERIIPRTATPGATDARVADFIDVMLAEWYSAADSDRFTSGLSDLDVRAGTLAGAGRSFVQSSVAQQTRVLEALDGELHARRQSRTPDADDHWFAMLKHLTVWGYYTSRSGIVDELRMELVPGRYDGNAKY